MPAVRRVTAILMVHGNPTAATSVMLAAPLGGGSRPPTGFGARTRGRGLILEHAGQVVPGGGIWGAARGYPSAQVVG
jgi:hypothetical protein